MPVENPYKKSISTVSTSTPIPKTIVTPVTKHVNPYKKKISSGLSVLKKNDEELFKILEEDQLNLDEDISVVTLATKKKPSLKITTDESIWSGTLLLPPQSDSSDDKSTFLTQK